MDSWLSSAGPLLSLGCSVSHSSIWGLCALSGVGYWRIVWAGGIGDWLIFTLLGQDTLVARSIASQADGTGWEKCWDLAGESTHRPHSLWGWNLFPSLVTGRLMAERVYTLSHLGWVTQASTGSSIGLGVRVGMGRQVDGLCSNLVLLDRQFLNSL